MPLPEGREPIKSEWFINKALDLSNVNRVEVIDNDIGRGYVKYNFKVKNLKHELQDEGKTLKIFITYEEKQ